MNQRIVYFLIFVFLFNYFKKNEGLKIEVPDVTGMLNKAMTDALKDKETPNASEIALNTISDALNNQDSEVNNSKISLNLDNDVNIDEQINNTVSNELENTVEDDSIAELVNEKIDRAISDKNALIIDTDGEEISNQDIVNEATVTINGEEVDTTGGGLNVGIIIFILIVVVLMMKK